MGRGGMGGEFGAEATAQERGSSLGQILDPVGFQARGAEPQTLKPPRRISDTTPSCSIRPSAAQAA